MPDTFCTLWSRLITHYALRISPHIKTSKSKCTIYNKVPYVSFLFPLVVQWGGRAIWWTLQREHWCSASFIIFLSQYTSFSIISHMLCRWSYYHVVYRALLHTLTRSHDLWSPPGPAEPDHICFSVYSCTSACLVTSWSHSQTSVGTVTCKM